MGSYEHDSEDWVWVEHEEPGGRHPCYGGPTRFATLVEALDAEVRWAETEVEWATSNVEDCEEELLKARDSLRQMKDMLNARRTKRLLARKKRVGGELASEDK